MDNLESMETASAPAPPAVPEKYKRSYPVAADIAEEEFTRLMFNWECDIDTEFMDLKERDDFRREKRKVILRIMDGAATVSTDGLSLTFKARQKNGEALEPMVFSLPGGDAYLGMDKYKEFQSMAKTYAVVGAMAGVGPQFFAALDGRDIKFCLAIGNLFLGQ